jgi:LPS export ABC transporter protein LptC
MLKITTVSFLFFAFASCVVEEPDLSRYTGSKIDNLEEAQDIEVRYSDSSFLVLVLKAPLSRRTVEKYSMEEEFPKGVNVTFYDKSGTPRSWLKADYARRDQINKRIIVQRNVLLYNDQGQRLDGPELIWDEKSREIYTDRFVKITDNNKVIYSYGFKSNEAFTRYELYAVGGDMILDDKKEK